MHSFVTPGHVIARIMQGPDVTFYRYLKKNTGNVSNVLSWPLKTSHVKNVFLESTD